MNEVRLATQLALGGVFLYSTLAKLSNPAHFARGVEHYQVLPRWVGATWVAVLIITVEAFLAVAHLTGWSLGVAVPLALVLLTGFALALASNLYRGRAIPCYCFGNGDEAISTRTLTRIVLLLMGEAFLAIDPFLLSPRPLTLQALNSSARLAESCASVAVLLLGACWVLSASDLRELLRPCRSCGKRVRDLDSNDQFGTEVGSYDS